MLEALKAWDPAAVGPFTLLGVLGSGGFGRVYLGQGPGGERVAVKVIKADLAEDPEFQARFSREVSAARKVDGKFTARVVDAHAAGSELWLATEYISGPTLREAVAAQGPMSDSAVLALAAGLADAAGATADPAAAEAAAEVAAEAWALAELLAARGVDHVSYEAWLRVSAAEEELARSLGRGDRVKLPHRDAVWSAARGSAAGDGGSRR